MENVAEIVRWITCLPDFSGLIFRRCFPGFPGRIRKPPMRLELQIPDDLAEDLARYKPRTLSLPRFCAYLLEIGIDRDAKLPAYRVGAGTPLLDNPSTKQVQDSTPQQPSSEGKAVSAVGFDGCSDLPLLPKECDTKKEIGQKKRKKSAKVEYSEGFTELWKTYQSAPDRVSSQSKPKAFLEWKKVVKLEGEDRLLGAVNNAIAEQKRRKVAGDFVGSLPDLFRWLRDGKYEVYLEEHKAQSAGRQWSADLGCWIEND